MVFQNGGFIMKNTNDNTPKTRDEHISTMQQELENAKALCAQYNDAFQKSDFKTAGKLEEDLKESIKTYNTSARAVFAYDALASDNPLLYIVNHLRYDTIKTKQTKVGDDKIPVLEIVTVQTRFDITSFNRKVWAEIGADPSAFFKLESLCYCCTHDVASGIGFTAERFKKEIGEFFKISDDGRQIKLAVSNTKLSKALTTVIGAMLGEEFGKKVIGADVRFFKEAFSAYDWKKSVIKASSLKQVGFIITDICHRIATNGAYDLQTKMVKAPK